MDTITHVLKPLAQRRSTISVFSLVSSIIKGVTKTYPLRLTERFGTSGFISIVTLGLYSLMMTGAPLASAGENDHFKGDPFAQIADNGQRSPNTLSSQSTSQTNEPPPITADELIIQASFLLMTNPQATTQSLKRLGQNNDIKQLFNDPANQQVLQRGNPAEIAQLPEYKRLQNNPDVKLLLSQYQTDDPRLASLLATYWQRSQQLQDNPNFQAVMLDPQIQSQLQAGNPLPLLTHPKGLELLRSLLNPTTPANPSANSDPSAN
ncbi:hypothetical protein [Pseudomaricurvus sp.]|uniref:hypothetical protein n=1 Tax=Pseudomaricurvus sp. TaxID=2004510 RepID=UPI003F6B5530